MGFKKVIGGLLLGLVLSCATNSQLIQKDEEYSGTMHSLISIYRDRLNHLSAVRASECPMVPSCSEYSAQAFKKHGVFVGWMMTCDRLMRCGRDEMRLVPKIKIGKSWKYYDPVESNDYWWTNGESRAHGFRYSKPRENWNWGASVD